MSLVRAAAAAVAEVMTNAAITVVTSCRDKGKANGRSGWVERRKANFSVNTLHRDDGSKGATSGATVNFW